MENFKGKAIYNPSGKAAEYSKWACNFYVGCSNGCTYCYLKKGRGAKVLGGNEPKLKACFKGMTEDQIMRIFECELSNNHVEIQKHGLFFSFTTDPMISGTADLTAEAIEVCQEYKVPVKLLTKSVDHLHVFTHFDFFDNNLIAIGFTLTGHDELEENASTNKERIYAMEVLKKEGFKTFASIEPIIDFKSSKQMISDALPYCDLFKVGLESGKKYSELEAIHFLEWINDLQKGKFYIKDSLRKLAKYVIFTSNKNFVDRDYNIFE